jgi:hypothetical protein
MARSRARSAFARLFVYTHRWLGIVLGFLFAGWFVSGVVLMYVGMPALSAADRLSRRSPIDASQLKVAPIDAVRAAGGAGDSLQLVMFGGRPVYRFRAGSSQAAVFADTGEPVAPVSAEQALAEARAFAPSASAGYDGFLETPDQWTLETIRQLPMHRIALGDTDDTRLYVSASNGDIVLKTTASSRRWAYPGAILHWIYLTPIRRHGEAWAQFIIWTSVAGTVTCIAGLTWGIWRYSVRRRYRLKRVESRSPYAGWMWWHHYAGLVFGVATLTWIFSGLLSMDPWDWHPGTAPTAQQRLVFSSGPLSVESISTVSLANALARARGAREASVFRSRGRLWLSTDAGVVPLDESGPELPLQIDSLGPLARGAMPGVEVTRIVRLDDYDAYYYDRARELPLPVYRVEYADAPATWLYVDPGRGVILRKEERLTRLNRWLYHGLHSLDFPFLYYRRPLWDVVVIGLSAGGLALTLTTIAPVWRRLRRHARRLSKIGRLEVRG